MDRHNSAVADIASRIRRLHAQDVPFRIYHGSTNSTRPLSFQRDRMVDISGLSNVVNVDTAARTALVEPNVPMDQLVAATLPHGLVAPVVMEFPGITVGGGFAGTGGESSSFRYGLFDRTVNWIELILATGEIVLTSEQQRPDLFRGAAGTFGTLGVTTLLEIRLVEARKFVELTYLPVSSASEAVSVLGQKQEDSSLDYLDGILFGPSKGVVCTGRLTDGNTLASSNSDSKTSSSSSSSSVVGVQRFSRGTDPWFYMHAADLWEKSPDKPTTELVPLVDYLFRYDRGAFWTGSLAFQYFFTPFNRITRWLLDPLIHTRVMYHALHKSGFSHRFIIQDLAVPISAGTEFIDYLDETMSAYPLWLCPLRPHPPGTASLHPTGLITGNDSSGKANAGSGNDMLLNVGVWCSGPASHKAFIEANRALEHKVYSLGGTKWLYAHTYYTPDEFWAIYDRDWYDRLREKYRATTLPNVYDKVRTDPEAGREMHEGLWAIWPLAGMYGVFSALFGGGYLLPSSFSRRAARSLALVLPLFLSYYLYSR